MVCRASGSVEVWRSGVQKPSRVKPRDCFETTLRLCASCSVRVEGLGFGVDVVPSFTARILGRQSFDETP